MCCSRRFSAAAHVLWSVTYICVGAVQLVAGIFFLISLPVFKVGSNIWTGAWNIVIGIGAAMLACIGDLTVKKQESLLYLAISILVANCINLAILEVGEWNWFLTTEIREIISQKSLKKLIFYAHITTSVSSAVAVLVSFIDTQLTFCSMQKRQKPKNVHEQVSDIEYIIPRKKTVAKQAQSIYSQYAQSWVFDADTTSSKNDSPYLKLPNNAPYDSKTILVKKNSTSDGTIVYEDETVVDHQKMFLVNPTVHVEPVSDESNGGGGGRSLNYMKSFSRTPSPVGVSESSSQDSSFNPPIYECLERLTEPALYRSRLNTAISLNAEQAKEGRDSSAAATFHPARPRSETFSKERLEGVAVPAAEKVQYASLMVELQQAFRSKRDRFQQQQQPTSPQSACDSSATVEDYSGSSRRESSSQDTSQRTEHKGSDTEFSKELEAALQLIQDLESPNTIETPSETCRSINSVDVTLPSGGGGGSVPAATVSVKWKDSSDSDSTKTLSECVSPPELLPEESTDTSQGKGTTTTTSVIVVAPAGGSGSESSSGYSSPSHGNSKQPTPYCSKPPSVSGSSCNLVGGGDQQPPVSYAICNTGAAAIISLFSAPDTLLKAAADKRKSVTSVSGLEVKISAKNLGDGGKSGQPVHYNTVPMKVKESTRVAIGHGKEEEKAPPRASSVPNGHGVDPEPSPQSTLKSASSRWNVKSLLKKKTTPPLLTPELESAIFKSESLAYLTELELLARHARNKSIQRQIEQRVQQQILGHSPSESQC